MSKTRGIALSVLTLSLAGCTMGPDWHQPHADLPTTFAPAAGNPTASRTVTIAADPNWWRILNDPTLTALEQQVASDNLDVAEATARLSQSRSTLQIAGASQLPALGANASYARERASPNGVMGLLGTTESEGVDTIADGSPGFGPAGISDSNGNSPPFNLWQYGFDASWELDLWGRARRETESAQAASAGAEDDRRAVLVSAEAELARDYVSLRGVQAELAITNQNLGDARRNLALTELRYSNGATTALDVANARADVASISATLPDLQNRVLILINAASLLLGQPPRALAVELATPAAIPPMPPQVPIGLPSTLAEQRPDIRAAADRLHEATAEIGVAQAEFYPQITLGGSFDIQALDASDLGLWNSRQFGFGPSISLPIFEGGKLRGQLHLRQAGQRAAAIAYRHTVLQAWHEVDDALNTYAAAQKQVAALADAVTQNRQALAMAQQQYAAGAADFLNVLTVQNRLLDEQRHLVQATAQTDLALVGLYKALGGGWQQSFPPAAPTLVAAVPKA